jgi:hypothetical protein
VNRTKEFQIKINRLFSFIYFYAELFSLGEWQDVKPQADFNLAFSANRKS